MEYGIIERNDMKIGRFIAGLDRDLHNKLGVHHNLTYEEAHRMANRYVRQGKFNVTYERRKGMNFNHGDLEACISATPNGEPTPGLGS